MGAWTQKTEPESKTEVRPQSQISNLRHESAGAGDE